MRRALILLQVPTALMVLYLDILSLAALLWRRRPTPAQRMRRFAILVPAHDEELLLPRLLDSLNALDYPRDLYDVYVVADNCTDRTASLAMAGGATVYERTDDQLYGKGYALRWLLQQLQQDGVIYDAYIIFDADSMASPNFLTEMSAHLGRGDEVIQAYYGVMNGRETWSTALRYVALALFNDLRPRGRDTLGLSAGLRGNGMCFATHLIERFGWEAFTLAEDAEFHLQLVSAGVKVAYAPGASVLAEMPVTLQQARSQNMRWERGRLQMLGQFGPRLLMEGLRRRDPIRLDAIAEQLVPPLSVLTGMAGCGALLAVLSRARGASRLAAAISIGQVAYVLTGLILVRAPLRAYTTLALAPLYIAWKIWLYALAVVGRHDREWVRTDRRAEKSMATEPKSQ